MAKSEDTTVTRLNLSNAAKGEIPEKVDNLIISSDALTDIGNKRLHNEDAFYSSDEKGVWFVADGVGGHNAGDFASQSLVEAISKFKPESNLDDSVETLVHLFPTLELKRHHHGHTDRGRQQPPAFPYHRTTNKVDREDEYELRHEPRQEAVLNQLDGFALVSIGEINDTQEQGAQQTGKDGNIDFHEPRW